MNLPKAPDKDVHSVPACIWQDTSWQEVEKLEVKACLHAEETGDAAWAPSSGGDGV